jgi:rSAM/selenodomain-associated transferase 2
MARTIGVVIPALDEAATITESVESAWRAGASEVVVSDGGSRDETVPLARAAGALVVESPQMRGRQLNVGASATGAEVLVFLHADTTLPPVAGREINDAIDSSAIFGGFRVQFREPHLRLRFAAILINVRCRLSRAPWGDQAQWVLREVFDKTGGFVEEPIMEDYEMALRMKRLGRTRILPSAVMTSGRRFLRKGLLKTALINWRIVLLWRLGVPAGKLAKIYRSQESGSGSRESGGRSAS